MIILNAKQIRDLAEFAGFTVDTHGEDLDTEYAVDDCPKDGVLDDDGVTSRHYDFIAFSSDYPDEGCVGLGDEKKA